MEAMCNFMVSAEKLVGEFEQLSEEKKLEVIDFIE